MITELDRRKVRYRNSPDGQALFRNEWKIYRKMVDNNYLFHDEAYERLRQVLTAEAPASFRFLDVACGDAGNSAAVLARSQVGSYCGVDLSGSALKLAKTHLAALRCPVHLLEGDFKQTLSHWRSPIDVTWVSLSLHHFQAPDKIDVLRSVARILSSGGFLVIYENASPDGENREEWLQRWDRQRPLWTSMSEEEWEFVRSHVHKSDFPETDETWRELGRQAGFTDICELYRAPTDLFRMYLLKA